MSAEATATALPATRADVTRVRRIVRFAFGVTLTMALATAIAWPLSFLSAVLVAMLLTFPVPLTLRSGVAFVGVIAIAMGFSLGLSVALVAYPLVFLGVAGLTLFRIFHAASGGGNPLMVLWMIVGILVVPLLTMVAPIAGALIAFWIIFGAAVAVAVTLFMQVIFPEPVTDLAAQPATTPRAVPEPATRFRSAAISTLAVLPLMAVFYFFQLSQHLVVLIFATILAITASSEAGFKMGSGLLAANIGGGVLTLVIYKLIVAVPELPFFVALILLTTLVVGDRRFSDAPTASLWGTALNTVLIVIGSVTTSTAEADSKIYVRLVQIGLAMIYVVAAFGMLEALWRRRRVD